MLSVKTIYQQALNGDKKSHFVYCELESIKSFSEIMRANDFIESGIISDFRQNLKNICKSKNISSDLESLLNDIYYYGDCRLSIFIELVAHIKTIIEKLNLKLSIYDYPFEFDFLEEVEKQELNNLLFI